MVPFKFSAIRLDFTARPCQNGNQASWACEPSAEIPMYPVRVGTCGWSYKGWEGVFYPDGLPAAGYVSAYAERFPVVEVDSTFYRSPSRKTVEGWDAKTPAHFGFTLKVPQ